jgi:hypothetical protein
MGGLFVKKIFFLATVFVMIMAPVGLCAVPTTSNLGDVQVGYNYYDLQKTVGGSKQGKSGFNEFYGNIGLGFGYGAFVNHGQGSGTSYTDFGLSDSILLPNVSLLIGQRRMQNDNISNENNLFWGATVKQNLGAVGAYATYEKGSDFKDEVVGLTYSINKAAQLDFSWKQYNDNHNITYNGFGGGINFKF